MYSTNLFLTVASTLVLSSCAGQMKNTRTVTMRVDGDCGMCEERIEAAAFVKGEAEAKWDPDTKMATISYDSTRTNADAIQRRIAQAGYDTPSYLAPDAAYAQLPSCCQYERTMKRATKDEPAVPPAQGEMHGHDAHTDHDHGQHSEKTTPTDMDPIAQVLMHYFALKDALVASNAKLAMKSADDMNGAMHGVDASKLPKEFQSTWTEVMQAVMPSLHPLAESGELEQQRALFAKLTEPMAKLVEATPQKEPIYLDHCPMFNGGSDWLSKEQPIKNPFYGDMMLGCGSVQRTIQ